MTKKIPSKITIRTLMIGAVVIILIAINLMISENASASHIDQRNMELQRRKLFGYAYGVYADEDYAYLCSGASLLIINTTEKDRPRLVGYIDTDVKIDWDWVHSVQVVDGYAYIADGCEGLCIINVSNKTHPEVVAHVETIGEAFDVHVVGDYAYVADGRIGGLAVIDIRKKENPKMVGSHVTESWTEGVYVCGDYAYIADLDNGLRIIDITNKESPKEVGFYDTDDRSIDLFVIDDYAYVADEYGGLRIIDVSNKVDPIEVGQYETDTVTYDVEVIGEYAYIADCRDGLGIIDISDKENPVEVGRCDTNGCTYEVYVRGDYAYLAVEFGGFRVINITDKQNPEIIGNCPTSGGFSSDIHVQDNFAFITYDPGLVILNLSNKNTMKVGVCPTPGWAWGLYVLGDYAYVADAEEGLRIIDVSNKWNPEEVGFWDTPGTAENVHVEGDYAYVADNSYGLRIIDVSNKEFPYEVGSYENIDNARDVYVQGDYAFVVDENGGLRILDIRNKHFPNEVGSYDTDGLEWCIHMKDDYAFVSIMNEEVIIIDTSDKENPELVSTYEDVVHIYDIYVTGNYAYLGDVENGVQIIDISDIEKPLQAGFYDVGYEARGVYSVDDHVYVVEGDVGFFSLKFFPPPRVQDLSFSAESVYRTNSLQIFANGTDEKDEESELECQIQYRCASIDWNDLDNEIFVTDHWEATFTPNENANVEWRYDIRVRFIDKNNSESNWLTIPNAIEVLNNPPEVSDVSFSINTIYTQESMMIFTNGNDVENAESDLHCQIQYQPPSGEWEELEDISFNTDHWEGIFSPSEDAKPGSYDFRVSLIDLDNDTSGWIEYEDQVIVKVNEKPIAEIDEIEPNPALKSDKVYFYGKGTDDKFVVLYVWRSSLDEELYNGSEKEFADSYLSLGIHTIYLKVRDDRGLWSDEVSTILTVCNEPTAKIISISPNPAYDTDSITFTGEGTSDGSITRYVWTSSLDDEIYNHTNANCELTDLSIGTHTISLRIQDEYGFWSEEVSITLEIVEFPQDNESPTVSILSPANLSQVFDIVSIIGRASDSDGVIEYVEISIDDGVWQRTQGTTYWTYIWNTNEMENGQHTIKVRSYDGEDYSEELNFSLIIDNEEEGDGDEEWYEVSVYIGGIIGTIIIIVIIVTFIVIRKRKEEYYDKWYEEEYDDAWNNENNNEE